MTARIEVEYIYFAYCPDCSAGTDENGTEEAAQRWAEQHDKDNHQDED